MADPLAWAVADHRPRTGEELTLETGERVLVTRGMEPREGWRRPPSTCLGLLEGVELRIAVRVPRYRG